MDLEDEQKEFVMELKKLPEDERLAYAMLYIGKKLERQNSVLKREEYQLRSIMFLILIVLFPILVILIIIIFKI
ncbi:MAG: hypothetical protein FK731_07125 [Asgard group archaeon]|nr:hypothetical protein [Asgard group archaeon]